MDDFYCPCADCGVYTDDGNFKNSKYFCHGCIDKVHNKSINISHAVRERIRSLCRKRGITTGELVRISGANQATVYEIVGGRSKHPSINTLFKVASAFDMSLSQFFDDPLFTMNGEQNKK